MIPMGQIEQTLVVYSDISNSSDMYKKKTHNGKFVDIKVHLYFKSRLVTINGVLDYIIKSVQAIPSMHTV